MFSQKIHKPLIGIFVALLCVSCQMKPWGVISEKEMTDVLVDLNLTTAILNIRIPIEQKAIRQQYTNAVFEKYGITREDFETSLAWYTENPKELEAIYTAVEERLTQMNLDVENYVYHPDLNPANDTIDTVDIWLRPTLLKYALTDKDSLRFEWNDSLFFAKGDRYIWSYLLTIPKNDTLQDKKFIEFGVKYADGTADTTKYYLSDSKQQRRLTINAKMHEKPIKIWGVFCASELENKSKITIDSILLQRIYNSKSHPLDTAWRTRMDSIQKQTFTLPKPIPTETIDSRKVNEIIAVPGPMTR